MKNLKLVLVAVLAIGFNAVSSASAEINDPAPVKLDTATLAPEQHFEFRGKNSFEFKGYSNKLGAAGYLFGTRSERFIGQSDFYWGIGIRVGSAGGEEANTIFMVPVDFSYEKTSNGWVYGAGVDLQALAVRNLNDTDLGYAGEISVGHVIESGLRALITVGYEGVFDHTRLNGLTYGIRLDFKHLTKVVIRAIND